MGALITLLYILEVLVAIMLVGIVLIQQSKSQGGLGALAGGTTESIFGASTGNVITKATVALATIFLTNTLLLAILTSQAGTGASTRSGEIGAGAEPPPAAMDGGPGETAPGESAVETPADAEAATAEAIKEIDETAAESAEAEGSGEAAEDSEEDTEE